MEENLVKVRRAEDSMECNMKEPEMKEVTVGKTESICLAGVHTGYFSLGGRIGEG